MSLYPAKNGLYYLASPYTHKDKAIQELRYIDVMKFTASLIQERYKVFSPIVHCHELAKQFGLPTDYIFWRAYNCAFIRQSEGIIIATIDGWTESAGVNMEIQLCRDLEKMIYLAEMDYLGKISLIEY